MSKKKSEEIAPRYATNPATGERFSLAVDDGDLILALGEARDLRDGLNAFIKALGREATERMDRSASWTMTSHGFKATGRSPEPPEEYEPATLFLALVHLVDAETITEEAAKAACEVETVYKPKVAGIHALMKISPEVKAALEECRKPVDREEYKRSRPAPGITKLPTVKR